MRPCRPWVDEIVMQPRAVIGGPGAYAFTADDVDNVRRSDPGRPGPADPPLLVVAGGPFDPNLSVFRCTNQGRVEYFGDQELADQPNAAQWQKQDPVTHDSRRPAGAHRPAGRGI